MTHNNQAAHEAAVRLKQVLDSIDARKASATALIHQLDAPVTDIRAVVEHVLTTSDNGRGQHLWAHGKGYGPIHETRLVAELNRFLPGDGSEGETTHERNLFSVLREARDFIAATVSVPADGDAEYVRRLEKATDELTHETSEANQALIEAGHPELKADGTPASLGGRIQRLHQQRDVEARHVATLISDRDREDTEERVRRESLQVALAQPLRLIPHPSPPVTIEPLSFQTADTATLLSMIDGLVDVLRERLVTTPAPRIGSWEDMARADAAMQAAEQVDPTSEKAPESPQDRRSGPNEASRGGS